MAKLLYAVNAELLPTIFLPSDRERIARVCEVIPAPAPTPADKEYLRRHVSDAEIVITSWGTAMFDAEVMAWAKKLKLLIHAAGSLKPVVSDALWERGVRAESMAAAISYGVAEYCLGCILTASKRMFWASEGTKRGQWKEPMGSFGGAFEIYSQKIGVIGAGHVGRHLIRLLKNFTCEVLVYDPYLPAEKAAEMGVQKVDSLEAIFSQCMAVTLCAASTDETRGMIQRKFFAMLPKGALFINVTNAAKGRELFDETELAEELAKGNCVACLDVSNIEPTPLGHPFRRLPNVVLTPHIAGVAAQNRLRIGAFAADEVEAYVQNRPLRFEVTKEMLARMA